MCDDPPESGWNTDYKPSCFTAYDVRGRIGLNFDAHTAGRIAAAFGCVLSARSVVVGRDVRESSPIIHDAVVNALLSQGIDVIDIGLAGTEEVYFATAHFDTDGGIAVTASHNPADYNGLKFIDRGCVPLSEDTFRKIMSRSLAAVVATNARGARYTEHSKETYAHQLLDFIEPASIAPLHILANGGNGVAGPALKAVESALLDRSSRLRFTHLHCDPDSTFPNGIPNPILPENQSETANAVVRSGADFGVAWDGDFDRCFFFDEGGSFVPGEYIVALLAGSLLAKEPGQTIIHDTRTYWNTQKVVKEAGGIPHMVPTGHAFIKQAMRDERAVYGGELSGHHYFRDFNYCDSGMIPMLLIADLISRRRIPLSELVGSMRTAFPSSGEINFRVENAPCVIDQIRGYYAATVSAVDEIDGLDLIFDDWRMSIRISNTEPLIRLNIETRGDKDLLPAKIAEVSDVIFQVGDAGLN